MDAFSILSEGELEGQKAGQRIEDDFFAQLRRKRLDADRNIFDVSQT